jgi:hypothetical protein
VYVAPDGYNRCRRCLDLAVKRWAEKNPEQRRAYNRDYQRKRRAKAKAKANQAGARA